MKRTKHILIVDDDQAILRGLSSLLTQADYAVQTATSGQQALALIDSEPDLIVLDLILPGLDGYEVCRRIRQLPAYIPVLMLTARDQSSDKILGLELGADAYVTKPFDPSELLAQIRALFRTVEGRGHDTGERFLVWGPIAMNDSRHQVIVHCQPIELTPKEYDLLRFFLQHPGRIFGRETLLREIWGHDFLGDSRTVDVTIQRLRAKIESDPAQPTLLSTVRGFGYRLVEPDES